MKDEINPYQSPQSGEGPINFGNDATISITRPAIFTDSIRAYRIWIDGVEAARQIVADWKA